LAAHRLDRRFVCIDLEPKYIEIAKKRYADLIAQQDLFKQTEADPVQEVLL